jgi:cell division inhibitor SulA
MTTRGVGDRLSIMGKIDTIKKSLEALSLDEQREVMSWFEELRERLFDEQIERDAKAGKLDFLMDEALEEYKAGLTKPL